MKTTTATEIGVGPRTKERILQELRADIISQQLRPGQAIREDELAQRYGISRTPIREMLRKLEQEDLVKIVPNKGVIVSELTSHDIEEILDIRLSLETTAARMAAVNVSSAQLTELKEIDRLLDQAVELQDSIISVETDAKLHNLILVAAGNTRAQKIIMNLMSQILRVRFVSAHKPGRIETTVTEHKDIVRALLGKDPEKAEEAMRIHLTNTKELLLPSSEIDRKFEEFIRHSLST